MLHDDPNTKWAEDKLNPFVDLKPRIDAMRALVMNTANGWAVGCDLDGTLCDVTWRQKYAQRREWDAFHSGIPEDKAVPAVLTVLRLAVIVGAPIIYFTGRPAKHRPATEDWLEDHFLSPAHVYMRADDDRRQDTVVKEQQYRQFQLDHPNWSLAFVLEDRNHVVAMWRSLGIPCFQVREPQY